MCLPDDVVSYASEFLQDVVRHKIGINITVDYSSWEVRVSIENKSEYFLDLFKKKFGPCRVVEFKYVVCLVNDVDYLFLNTHKNPSRFKRKAKQKSFRAAWRNISDMRPYLVHKGKNEYYVIVTQYLNEKRRLGWIMREKNKQTFMAE